MASDINQRPPDQEGSEQLPTIPLHREALIAAPVPGDRLMRASVGAEGELLTLWCAGSDWNELYYHDNDLRTVVARDKGLRQVDLRVSVHRLEETLVLTVPSRPLPSPTVQLLPEGRVLLVSSRSNWRQGAGPDRNAIIYRMDGTLESEATLGNDITHLFADLDGAVWAGYGAPGIFGNDGWGPPSGPVPVGSPGLVRFSPVDMGAVWGYPVGTAWGDIVSCDALNVGDYDVWMCYSHGSPIVRIAGGTITGWHTEGIQGVHAIAVDEPRIALFGGYGTHADQLILGTLGDDGFQIAGRYRVVLPDGQPLGRVAVFGRGPVLHAVIGNTWYQLKLSDTKISNAPRHPDKGRVD